MLHLVSGVQPPEHLGAPHHLRGHHVYLALQLREHGTPGGLEADCCPCLRDPIQTFWIWASNPFWCIFPMYLVTQMFCCYPLCLLFCTYGLAIIYWFNHNILIWDEKFQHPAGPGFCQFCAWHWSTRWWWTGDSNEFTPLHIQCGNKCPLASKIIQTESF